LFHQPVVTLHAALKGTPPWSVVWSDGFAESGIVSSNAFHDVVVNETTMFYLQSLRDAYCAAPGGSLNQTVTVTNSRPHAIVSVFGSSELCTNTLGVIRAELFGQGPWNVAWSDGAKSNKVGKTGVTNFVLQRTVSKVTHDTNYSITRLDDAYCSALTNDLVGEQISRWSNPILPRRK